MIGCDICGQPAKVMRPETETREEAFYCAYDAKRYLGWGDTYRVLSDEDVEALEEMWSA